jgi:hypothetical protein
MRKTELISGEPLLLDRYLLRYEVTEIHTMVVDADTNTTWQAIPAG